MDTSGPKAVILAKAALLAAASACVLWLAGCAAITASNEPRRNDALIARVQPGMTTDEVRALLGPPDQTMPFPLSASVAWDYRLYDTWGYMVIFSATFGPDGRVASKISRRINDGGRNN
jgi:outer membrane protein assembly factor BamE (lipoprotein component of BamABCDE complex)